MNLEIKLAVKRGDVLRCQYLIAEAYNRHYDIFFSNDIVNLDARIEPYPDRYMMGLVNGDLAATAGLYLHYTYSERFGQVTNADINQKLEEAGVLGRYSADRRREVTKLVIRDDWQGRGLGHLFFQATHCRDFLQLEADDPCVVICSATVSIFQKLHARAGITTRLIKPFPLYQVHSLYRSVEDPMESRLIIPDIDIPSAIYGQDLPIMREFEPIKGAHR